MQKHGASQQKQPKHNSYTLTYSRPNTTKRSTPRNAKASEQMEASSSAMSTSLGMMKPGNVPTACTDRDSLFEGQEKSLAQSTFSSKEILFQEKSLSQSFSLKGFSSKKSDHFLETFSQSFYIWQKLTFRSKIASKLDHTTRRDMQHEFRFVLRHHELTPDASAVTGIPTPMRLWSAFGTSRVKSISHITFQTVGTTQKSSSENEDRRMPDRRVEAHEFELEHAGVKQKLHQTLRTQCLCATTGCDKSQIVTGLSFTHFEKSRSGRNF